MLGDVLWIGGTKLNTTLTMGFQNGNLGINTLTGIGCRLLAEKLKSSISVSITPNVLWLCVRWGFPALKPIDSTNFNLSTNDYR
jgi:hypothetical protein